MGITWQPVNPDKYGSQREVLQELTPKVTPAEGTPYSSVNVSTYFCEADTMLELGFGELANYRDKANVIFYVLEVACYTQDVTVKDNQTNKISLERQGVGFRIGVASWDIAFNAAFTLAIVAANAQLEISQTEMSLDIHGNVQPALTLLEPFLGVGPFNLDNLQKISSSASSLADYFAEHWKTLNPVPLAIAPLPVTDFQPFKSFYSGQFATESIHRGKSVKQALEGLAEHPESSKNVDPIFVRAIYNEFGLLDDKSTPDPTTQQRAAQILTLGMFP